MRSQTTLLVLLTTIAAQPAAAAPEGRPSPAPPEPAAGAAEPAAVPPLPARHGRRADNGDRVVLAFNEVPIDETFPFIIETTGKVIMPKNITTLKAKKVTLINDSPMDRHEALDRLFEAFRLNDVGVIEHPDRIIIFLLSEMPNIDPPVLGTDEAVGERRDRGTIVTKIFAVENQPADSIIEQIQEPLPDYATVMVDPNSNQIVVTADLGLVQRLGKLVRELDREYIAVKTQTFRLAYADANEIAQNILDLFEDAGTTTTQPRSATRRVAQRQRAQRRTRTPSATTATPGAAEAGPGPTVELRVTVNVQQNSVTVSGEPSIVGEIAQLIDNEWDMPRPETTKKVYHLRYTDPIKMRDMLNELLGDGTGGATARRPRGGQAAAGRADVAEAIGGIYQIEAYPDSNALVVVCKTEEAFNFLDSLIEELDQPLYPGVPEIVPLKHADAEEVADQINAVFAPAGARVDLLRRQRGLEGFDISGPSGGGGGTTGGAGQGREGAEGLGATITFPWQQGREQEDEAPPSALIGKVRVVPIHRQNACMILAAPEYRHAVRQWIVEELDKPGRQVMIATLIAEVELTDELALGFRFSNNPAIAGGPLTDNRLSASSDFTGEDSGFLDDVFDMTTLNVDASVTAVIQALQQKTNVRILQEPRVFTADNQEASFFEGQDVPILSNTFTSEQGSVNESVEYQAVGIGLNVRPRITQEGDVDMEINLEISNIAPGQTTLNSPIFDRRETTTQIIVKNGQTIVVSGILREQESRLLRKVPVLGDIPLLGELFKSRENSTTRTELLAFITPVVVNDPSENEGNFNAEELERLDDLRRPLDEQKADMEDPARISEKLLHQQVRRGRPWLRDVEPQQPEQP